MKHLRLCLIPGKVSALTRRTIVLALSCILCLFTSLAFTATPAHADNERYKAIPMGAGGYVFILDTRDGHAWTWQSGGQGKVGSDGTNPHIQYQGNVRNNMKSPKGQAKASAVPVPPSGQPERY